MSTGPVMWPMRRLPATPVVDVDVGDAHAAVERTAARDHGQAVALQVAWQRVLGVQRQQQRTVDVPAHQELLRTQAVLVAL
jgi:hypothetical protein